MDRSASQRLGWCVTAAAALFLAGPASAAPVQLPDGSRVEKVDFERHVQGLLGRLGCNSGACHGSFQGKGGLYLSLFGYSAEKDYQAFTRDGMGRRISPASPDTSLVLLKAADLVPHGGGRRFDPGSWQYQIIREWIAQGAPWTPKSGDVARMEITPREHLLAKPGESGKFKVEVTFADGTKEDMTHFCEFRVSDDFVAELTGTAEVKSLRPGDTAVVISYRGHVDTVRAMVKVPPKPGFAFPNVAEVNYVDREVFAKLRKLNIVPSELADDGEFLRRVTIDAIGQLPSPDEVRRFLADKDPQKRAKKIDELLTHPLHAALWATKFSDITGNNIDVMEQPAQLRPKRSKMWHDWFRKRIAENVPYDEIIKGVLTATSREGLAAEDWIKQAAAIEAQAARGFDSDYANRASLDLFWRRNLFTIEQMAEHTAAAFLGVRLECAQCHKHPFDRWTMDDYRAYANIFTTVRFANSPETQALAAKVNAERQKERTDALAKVDQEYAGKKKAIEEPIDKDFAEKKKAVEDKAAKEYAEKVKELEAKLADEPDPAKKKSALDKLERDNINKLKASLGAVDRDQQTAKRTALATIEREIATKKQQVQIQFAQGVGGQIREVFISTQPVALPKGAAASNYANKPKALGGPEIEREGDPRVKLFEWMRQPDNPFFARSFVNRVWAHYFGIGLVDPVDNFSVANPPSNERLLDALAKDFVESKYDIRKLERTILQSRTYQLSAVPNETNKDDRNGHARSYPRRMMAEVVVDVLHSALDVTENFGPDVPPGVRAVEIAPNRLQQNVNLANVFRIFGRPPRTSTCDCERAAEPALPQTLFLMTDTTVLTKITAGRLKKLLADPKPNAEVLDELFLATLTRFPTDPEKQRLLQHVENKKDRQAAFTDVVWALINTREFILNH